MSDPSLTPERLLAAYANGYFPMAETRDSNTLRWFAPERRGVLPLNGFHVPRSLAKFLRKNPFAFTTDTAFPDVIRACAEARPGHPETWINDEIIALYSECWRLGCGHSVECWQDGRLVGGLYGLSLGGAFFGESMFSRVSNASKCALAHLVKLLTEAGYTLLDAQFTNDHLQQFGMEEISREEYMARLQTALKARPAACF